MDNTLKAFGNVLLFVNYFKIRERLTVQLYRKSFCRTVWAEIYFYKMNEFKSPDRTLVVQFYWSLISCILSFFRTVLLIVISIWLIV